MFQSILSSIEALCVMDDGECLTADARYTMISPPSHYNVQQTKKQRHNQIPCALSSTTNTILWYKASCNAPKRVKSHFKQ